VLGTLTLPGLAVAYAVGATLGLAAAGSEWLLGGRLIPAAGAAAYSIFGGLTSSVLRWALGFRLGPGAARAGALSAVGAFGSLYLLYFVNVEVLPGEPYYSARSIAADFGVLAAVLTAAFWVSHSPGAQQARERWGRPLVFWGFALLLASASVLVSRWPGGQPTVPRQGIGPDLLLVVLDSARRDRLGLYGCPRPISPAIDSLAARARIYDAAYAASSWTVPSVSEILGLGLVERTQKETLAEQLAGRGYVTACFTDNPHMRRESSLMRGFDRVERSVGEWRGVLQNTIVSEVVERLAPGDDQHLADRALSWARRQKGPFFLYVHLMDSHTPYRRPPIDGKPRKGRHIEFPRSDMDMSAEETEDVVARYEGGVRSADAVAGRLVTALTSRERPTLAVVTADHGESLGEAGRWFHGGTLAPELLAIPLLVLGNGVSPGRIATPEGHEAIRPTLLAAAGIPCQECSGPDLRAAVGDGIIEGALPPHLIYRLTKRFKVVIDDRDQSRRLFDLKRDPQESEDIARQMPEIAESLAVGLALNAGERERTPIPADLRERLNSLGYTQ
jgi:hypothetical protein